MPALKRRKLWLRKLWEKSSSARELPLPRKPPRRRPWTRTRLPSWKLKTKLPRRPRRRQEARERNDQPSYLNTYCLIQSLNIGRSESKFVGSGSVWDGESGSKISFQVLNLLDVFQKTSINWFLDVFQLSSPLGIGLITSLNSLLSDFGSILELVLGESSRLLEERIINVGLDSVNCDLGGGSNHVSRVDSSKRNTINGVRSSN